MAAEGEDPAVVAVVDDLEGHNVPAAHLVDQAIVPERGEQSP